LTWQSDEIATAEQSVKEAIEDLCYVYLEQAHGGWEDRRRPLGKFRFDVAKRAVELEFSGRFLEPFTNAHP
jgi:hypothetical protein